MKKRIKRGIDLFKCGKLLVLFLAIFIIVYLFISYRGFIMSKVEFKQGASLNAVNPASGSSYDFYISNSGSDSNSGTISSPFATLVKARDTIRNIPRPLDKPVNVYLRGGTYYLADTFKLDDLSRDSGSASYLITYQSYPGEKAVISGGRKLSLSWSSYNSNIYYTNIGDLNFNSLFVDGQRAIRARSPNAGNYPITQFDADNNSAFYFKTGEINPAWRKSKE